MKLNQEATNLTQKAELKIHNLKFVIFNEKILKFDKNFEKINRSILGSINKIPNSLILTDDAQINNFLSVFEFKNRDHSPKMKFNLQNKSKWV